MLDASRMPACLLVIMLNYGAILEAIVTVFTCCFGSVWFHSWLVLDSFPVCVYSFASRLVIVLMNALLMVSRDDCC